MTFYAVMKIIDNKVLYLTKYNKKYPFDKNNEIEILFGDIPVLKTDKVMAEKIANKIDGVVVKFEGRIQ